MAKAGVFEAAYFFSAFFHLGLGCDRLRGRWYSLPNVDAIRRLKSIPLIGIIIVRIYSYLLRAEPSHRSSNHTFHSAVGAKLTSEWSCHVVNYTLVFVASIVSTDEPYLPVTASGYIPRGQFTIFRRVPDADKTWVSCC